jgi:hypothetical protein
MDDKIIELIRKQIHVKQSQLADALASGAAKDYAQYQFICGEIRGLTAVEMYLQDLVKHLETSDE